MRNVDFFVIKNYKNKRLAEKKSAFAHQKKV